jgi:hypothetical protein
MGIIIVTAAIGNSYNFSVIPTGVIVYSISKEYVNFGNNYKSYFLGSDLVVSNSSMTGFGRAYIEDRTQYLNVTTYSAIRTLKTSVAQVREGTKVYNVTYIDIWIIRLSTYQTLTLTSDFNLKARCLNIATTSWSPLSTFNEDSTCTVTVQINNNMNSVSIPVTHKGRVVVNFVISTVEVGI